MKTASARSLSNPETVPQGFTVNLIWEYIAVENEPASACRSQLWETFEIQLVRDGIKILGHTPPRPYKSGEERCTDGEFHETQSVACTLLISSEHSPQLTLEKIRNFEAGLLIADGKPRAINRYWESMGYTVTL